MKKIIVIGILLLLIGVNVSGDINTKEPASSIFDGNILYVGGSGPNNYTSIQGAIDDASDGDTLYVYNGLYLESIVIDKSIQLLGENRDSTIINGISDYVIVVSSPFVNITNFYISSYLGIHLQSDYIIISNCTIIIETTCIFSNTILANNNTINHNIIIFNEAPYYYEPPSGSVIYLEGSDNKIFNNEVHSASESGIIIIGDRNLIHANEFTCDPYYFYHFNYDSEGEIIIEGNANIISNNYLESEEEYKNHHGIKIKSNSKHNLIINNTIIGYNGDGIDIFGSNYNIIKKNNIRYCHVGISISSSSLEGGGGNNIISENNISRCGLRGIGIFISNNNNISYNIIHETIGVGIEVMFFSRDNIIYHNNFIDNNRNARFCSHSFFNEWVGNYWDIPRMRPYPIFGNFNMGLLLFIPIRLIYYWMDYPPFPPTMIKFDWNPASEPYDIEVS